MVDLERGQIDSTDPMRLCPICRSPISVLAVKCRFCGAAVERPKKDPGTLTVKDLGGEHIGTYSVSGNVTEAFETFMMEEKATQEAQQRDREAASRRSVFSRKEPKVGNLDATGAPRTRLPELDRDRRELAESIMSSSSKPPVVRLADPPWIALAKKAGLGLGGLAGLVILLYVISMGWSSLSNYWNQAPQTDTFVYPNRALEMIAAGENPAAALEEALTAIRYNNTEENQGILKQAREHLVMSVEERAFSRQYNRQALESASGDIARAGRQDTDPQVLRLMEEINREVSYHKFILTQLDAEAGTATFRLNNPYIDEPNQTVMVGELLQDRFLVKNISSRGVYLEDVDAKAEGRRLLARPMALVAAE